MYQNQIKEALNDSEFSIFSNESIDDSDCDTLFQLPSSNSDDFSENDDDFNFCETASQGNEIMLNWYPVTSMSLQNFTLTNNKMLNLQLPAVIESFGSFKLFLTNDIIGNYGLGNKLKTPNNI